MRTRGGGSFDVDVLERAAGFACVRLSGRGVRSLMKSEPGGHRWQRVPPTEKRGRVHTSTVTVAVVEEVVDVDKVLKASELRFDFYKGTGAGGQHRNKTESCVRVVHVPTGVEAKSESERSQHQNKRYALAALCARVVEARREQQQKEQTQLRRAQVGSGQRGDKVRTVRVQDGIVTCERTGNKTRLKEYLRGDLSWLE